MPPTPSRPIGVGGIDPACSILFPPSSPAGPAVAIAGPACLSATPALGGYHRRRECSRYAAVSGDCLPHSAKSPAASVEWCSQQFPRQGLAAGQRSRKERHPAARHRRIEPSIDDQLGRRSGGRCGLRDCQGDGRLRVHQPGIPGPTRRGARQGIVGHYHVAHETSLFPVPGAGAAAEADHLLASADVRPGNLVALDIEDTAVGGELSGWRSPGCSTSSRPSASSRCRTRSRTTSRRVAWGRRNWPPTHSGTRATQTSSIRAAGRACPDNGGRAMSGSGVAGPTSPASPTPPTPISSPARARISWRWASPTRRCACSPPQTSVKRS